jgi:superfamily II RNA helicase
MTDILLKQNIDKRHLSIFIRDLSSNININLKHMIEDLLKENDKNHKNNKNKNSKNPKKVVVKKKDLIIQEQNKKREEIKIKDDLQKIDFLYESINYDKPLENTKKLKTDQGMNHFKFKLLSDKKLNIRFKILLYYDLKETTDTLLTDEYKNILEKIRVKLEDYEYKAFMMKELADYLPPLNSSKHKLDDWQKEIIHYIHKKESVIVKAPTSSGKSFVAMATGIIHKKILYVCPAKPVAFQVGAHFIHMGYKVHYFVENLSHNSYDSKTNIFIGTPEEIENNLYRFKEKFDYAVFDEIHNLNSSIDGNIYENIIKLIDCNFLALSATIKNIDFLKNIFQNINPEKKIHYIEYNKRFINHQKWIWNNNKMIKIHPFTAFKKVNDYGLKNTLNFTPDDCSSLWEIIEEVFEDEEIIDGCSPDEYFTEDRLISLDDCIQYEGFLKSVLCDAVNNDNDNLSRKAQKVMNHFQLNIITDNNNNNDIISFIRNAKDMNMLPMIMFHTNEKICHDIFHEIYEYLDQKEYEEYPFHYEILEKKEEYFQKYINDRDIFENKLVISKSVKDSVNEKRTKLESFDKKEKDLYISNIMKFYGQKLNDIRKSDHDNLKDIQTKNLKKEMNHFLQNPDFNSQDIFQKHKDFIFTVGSPMSGDTIRNVRREIMNTLGIKISYESPLFQMLKRGIGLYTDSMPDEYNWILQKLLSKREIGIVISDKTLCLGIDLPIRTSCFLGIDNVTFSKDEYLQMSGRAGRRGLDTRGNIIFYGDINYLSLMDGELPEIKGSDNNIYTNYNILKKLNQTMNVGKIYENMIHNDRKCIGTIEINELEKASWFLRKYKNSNIILNKLFDIECELYKIENQYEKEVLLLNQFNEIIVNNKINDIYQLKKIKNFEDIYLIKEYINLLIYVYNHINKDKYLITRRVSKEVFMNLNHILFTSVI